MVWRKTMSLEIDVVGGNERRVQVVQSPPLGLNTHLIQIPKGGAFRAGRGHDKGKPPIHCPSCLAWEWSRTLRNRRVVAKMSQNFIESCNLDLSYNSGMGGIGIAGRCR